jgi:hypothetical protein
MSGAKSGWHAGMVRERRNRIAGRNSFSGKRWFIGDQPRRSIMPAYVA